MRKKSGIVLMALIMLILLSACNGPPKAPAGASLAPQDLRLDKPTDPPETVPTTAPIQTDETDWDTQGLNPGDEEKDEPDFEAVATTLYPYAGATPMPLNPVDMPTPTEPPPLTFAYQTYDITRLGITFEAPIGWTMDETVENTIILRQPDHEVIDNYRAFLSVEIRSMGSSLKVSEMKTEVQDIMKTLGGSYTTFTNTSTAERTLMDGSGVYANYRGVQADGTIVRGRIHVASVDNKKITMHLSCPAGYNETYMDGPYKRFRNSLKQIK